MDKMPSQVSAAEEDDGEPAQVHRMGSIAMQVGDEQNKVTGLRGDEGLVAHVREDVHRAAQGGEE